MQVQGDDYWKLQKTFVLKELKKSKDNIQVLSELDGKVVAIKQDHNIAIAFHPELTDDTRIHEYFIQEILDCVV